MACLRISVSGLGQSATFLLSEALLVLDQFRTELLLLSSTLRLFPSLQPLLHHIGLFMSTLDDNMSSYLLACSPSVIKAVQSHWPKILFSGPVCHQCLRRLLSVSSRLNVCQTWFFSMKEKSGEIASCFEEDWFSMILFISLLWHFLFQIKYGGLGSDNHTAAAASVAQNCRFPFERL